MRIGIKRLVLLVLGLITGLILVVVLLSGCVAPEELRPEALRAAGENGAAEVVEGVEITDLGGNWTRMVDEEHGVLCYAYDGFGDGEAMWCMKLEE